VARSDKDQRSSLVLSENRYPTGWFQIAWSDEVAVGEIKSLRYFGEDLILWRGEDGALTAQDAYCLHLGMNIGVRGTVEGNEVKCPWHGWKWNAEGRNTEIPFSELTCKTSLKLKTYPLVDWYGAVLVWHDLAGREPMWQPDVIPDLEEEGSHFPFLPSCRIVHRIKAHPQMPLENSCDIFHVHYVHGGEPANLISLDFDGPYAIEQLGVDYGSKKEKTWLTPDGQEQAVIHARMGGIGNTWLKFPAQLIAGIQITNVTPVDDVYSDYWFGMTTRRKDEVSEEPSGRERKMIDLQMKVIEQDFFTWENMKVLHAPNFAPEEAKNYSALRRWARQFYPNLEDGADMSGAEDEAAAAAD
jgi:phenylpropionate dioxygenase-like ring-hydroxylating dioxygenase large terminal subunit